LSDLEKHSSKYENFGEAEMFMYHMAKVERYEPRLECMAYLGNFDELLSETQPVRVLNCGCFHAVGVVRKSVLLNGGCG
jgi:hypothetical protein